MPEVYQPNHEIICGTIGMGKSFWVLYKILKSFEFNQPLCYIDPKGDTYRNLLSILASTPEGQKIWEKNRHRILLMNPVSPSDYILGFNAIEPMEEFLTARPDRVALLADNLTSHIRRQSGFEQNEAMRMQNILSAAIGLLVQGGEGRYAISELPYLFLPYYAGKKAEVYNPFVESLLPKVTHYGTESFWNLQWPTMLPNDRREWVQSSEGRIYPYIFDQRCLMTTCAIDRIAVDFRQLVDQGYWLFVNLPYPLLSEQVTTLIGNLLITKIFYACMQRPQGSRNYRLILDEAKFFNTGPLDRLLETSRAYNLWLTLVIQNLNQMCRSREGRVDESLKETVKNNVRYFSIFYNSEDAEELADLMFPVTGQKLMPSPSFFTSGQEVYKPVAVERNENARRFMNLGKRFVILYDKFGAFKPYVWKTPEVPFNDAPEGQIDLFEKRHLMETAVPAKDIMDEIVERRNQIQAMFSDPAPVRSLQRSLRHSPFGGVQ